MRSTTSTARQMISSALEVFSDEDKLEGDFPWSEGRVAHLVDDSADYEELKKNLRAIEAVKEQLQQMLTSATNAHRKLEEKFIERANKRSFRELPDEILAIIIEMACQEYGSRWYLSGAANSLSLVSRHFREVVLGLPAFWSQICSPPFRLKKAELFASRATANAICLSIKGSSVFGDTTAASEHIRVMGMYQFAVSISARIQKMALLISDDDMPHLQQIYETCARISLPSLSELKLVCPNSDVGREIKSLCHDWDMPCLQTLTLTNVLPDLPIDVRSRIKSCSLEANRGGGPGELLVLGYWFTGEIVGFLFSLTSVDDLRVAVQLVGDHERPEQDPVMNSVKTLCLDLQNTEVARSRNVLDYIAFPSITSFKLQLGLSDVEVLRRVLNHVNFRIPPTSVTNVTVAIGIEYEDRGRGSSVYEIGEWCERFGEINCLKLESKSDYAHGLFAFASPFDALDVVDDEGSVMNGEALENIPFVEAWSRPRRKAIIDTKNVVKYVDEDDSSDSDSDF